MAVKAGPKDKIIVLYDEVRHRSSDIYKKSSEVFGDPRKEFFVFANEHHKLELIQL